jgi:hypothetical protein
MEYRAVLELWGLKPNPKKGSSGKYTPKELIGRVFPVDRKGVEEFAPYGLTANFEGGSHIKESKKGQLNMTINLGNHSDIIKIRFPLDVDEAGYIEQKSLEELYSIYTSVLKALRTISNLNQYKNYPL